MKIDITKKYRTRDGHQVQHLHRAPEGWPNEWPWRGWVDGEQATWTDDGCNFGRGREHDWDLIEIREPREFEVVVSTPQNTRFKVSEIDGKATDDLARGIREVPAHAWEIIRVREIID